MGEISPDVSPSGLSLKLAITNSALRYFVISEAHNQVIFFGDYTLHHVLNDTDLSQRIEKIFEKDEVLQLPFHNKIVALDTKYSLVPSEFSFMINHQEQLTQQKSGTEIVFEGADVLVQSLKKLLPGVSLLHLSSTFFDLQAQANSETLFVNVAPACFDIIYFGQNNNLTLMNRYTYQAATDFIYFLLLCCEELKIDREATKLVLLGEVNEDSKIYELCYRYFRNVDFMQKPDEVNFSRAFDAFPKHLHYNLYNLKA